MLKAFPFYSLRSELVVPRLFPYHPSRGRDDLLLGLSKRTGPEVFFASISLAYCFTVANVVQNFPASRTARFPSCSSRRILSVVSLSWRCFWWHSLARTLGHWPKGTILRAFVVAHWRMAASIFHYGKGEIETFAYVCLVWRSNAALMIDLQWLVMEYSMIWLHNMIT